MRKTLRAAIFLSGVQQKAIERALDMGDGYLSQVLGGRIDLKVRHLEIILERIDFDPREFFEILYSTPDDDDHAMMQRFAAYAAGRTPRVRASILPADLHAAIVDAVRDVLAGAGLSGVLPPGS